MRPLARLALLLMALGPVGATVAHAQLTVLNGNVPAGFAMTGFIQAATLKPGGAANAGGTLTVNNITMIVPDNTVIQMPAHTLTWAQLFDTKQSAPVFDSALPPPPVPPITHPPTNSIGQPITGLALSDAPTTGAGAGALLGPGFPSVEVTVLGNIDAKGTGGNPPGSYVVALILPISQEIANGGAGFITAIDYAKGRLEVNGTLNKLGTGTVIEINDPVGRYGFAHSPDPRFSADTDNPTVTSANGYPMGVPKAAPPAIDPDRPLFNRPLNPAAGDPQHDPFLQVGAPLMSFTMPAKSAPNQANDNTPDPWRQAPFMVGDFVTYSGTLLKFDPNAPVTPFNPGAPASATNRPMSQQFYVSANTVQAAGLEIVTAPGNVAQAGPAYMMLFKTVAGAGGASLTVPANPALGTQGGTIPIAEPRQNIVIRGFVTDPTQLVDIFAVDVNPANGQETPRLLGTVLPQPGFPIKGNRGRFIFDVGRGNFLPVTREYRVQTRHGQNQLGPQKGLNNGTLDGLQTGQYQAPNFTFQIADAPVGFPVSPSNFNDFPFLAKGEGTRNLSGANVTIGPLTPFPPSTP
ncbi:MAG: hypothetical protein JOZ17_27095 [Acetobacteraceae bacterium]|nr:hypothetical protein [Acetobacteraceae bacterium]MBV8613916.1 hypothetical protein [Acetobacteraceae bacterium]